MRLTGTGAGVLATSVVLGGGAVSLASPALGVVTVATLLAVASAVLLVASAPRLVASLDVEATLVRRGDHLTARLRLPPARPLLRLAVELDTPDFGPAVEAEAVGPPRDSGTPWTFRLRATRHGTVSLGPPVLTQTDPFGLCRRRTSVGSACRLLVGPATVDLARMPVYSRPAAFASGRGTTADSGETDTLRAYELGDDIRLIHWPNSARTGEILVRRHITPQAREFVVLHDTASISYASEEDFEAAVDFSASLVAAATARDIAVRLATTTGEASRSWSEGDRCTAYDLALAFAAVQLRGPGAHEARGEPLPLGRHVRTGLVRAAACTVVTGEPVPALLDALREPALPGRLTLVCLGRRRPDEAVVRWAQERGAVVVDAADARGAAAQWSAWSGARR